MARRPADDNADAPLTGWGGQLRAMRERAGFTQMELAQKSGLSQSTISHVETGRRNPSRAVALIWAEACGATLDLPPLDVGALTATLSPRQQHNVYRLIQIMHTADDRVQQRLELMLESLLDLLAEAEG